MNSYGQRWAPWSWAFVLSLVLWVAIIWLAMTLVGCGALGAEGHIKINKAGSNDPPVPPPTPHPECRDAASLNCCCDMSNKGIITCRCPHPGGIAH